MKPTAWNIPKAQAYGGILLTRQGHVLLREPTNHFEGYVWTFAKGRPESGDSPEQTALREVLEETGYVSEVVDVLPGLFASSWSTTAFFVMRHHGIQQPTDWETASTRWVTFEQAARLIGLTTNGKGRARDLAVLEAARDWFTSHPMVEWP